MSSDNIFMKIIRGEIKSEKVYEDELMIVIKDIHPVSPYHYLVIPRKEIISIAHAQEEDALLLGKMLLRAAELMREAGVSENGYRLVFNIGKDGGQTVPHLHLHVLGGKGLGWP